MFALGFKFELGFQKRSIAAKTQLEIGRLSKDVLLRVKNFCTYDIRSNKGITKGFQNLVFQFLDQNETECLWFYFYLLKYVL